MARKKTKSKALLMRDFAAVAKQAYEFTNSSIPEIMARSERLKRIGVAEAESLKTLSPDAFDAGMVTAFDQVRAGLLAPSLGSKK